MPSATSLLSNLSPWQPSSSRRSATAGSVGSMRSRGHGTSPSRDRASSYVGPPFLKYATVSGVPLSSGGSHETVAASHPHVRISAARSMLAAWSTRGGRERCPEEPVHIASPPFMGLRDRLQPFRGSCVPGAIRPRPANHRGPRPGVWPPALVWDGGVLRWGISWSARCHAPLVPVAHPLRARDVRFPRAHGIASDGPPWEQRAPEVLRETPRQVPVGVGVLLWGTLRGAVQEAD